MNHHRSGYVILCFILSMTVGCSTLAPAKMPLQRFSVDKLENQAQTQLVEVVFKDGKTQRAVISLAHQQYWRLISEQVFKMDDVNKIKIVDRNGGLLTEITSDSLANVVVIFKLTEKGIEKIGQLF